MRNLPVIEPQLPQDFTAVKIATSLVLALRRWDRAEERGGFVLSLELPQMNFDRMQALAQGIVAFAALELSPGQAVVLVTEDDFAQILGQSIKALAPDQPLVVVDQVVLGEGDFIDIGEPMFDGRVVPVSVKTLVFYQ